MVFDANKLKLREERHLIERALGGQELAWKQILIRYKKTILKAIKSHLYKFHDTYDSFKSEDIYQEVLMKLHRSALRQFLEKDSGAKLSSFIFTVAVNTAKDYTKSKLGQASLKEINPEVGNDTDETLDTLIFVDERCVHSLYEKEEERKILQDELISLEFETRRVVELYLSGEKNKNIASLTKIGEAKINKTIFNFKKKLEKKYKEVG